jgi:hypothetical protein
MSSGTASRHSSYGEPIPVFPVPELSFMAIEALRSADLEEFYQKNRENFTRLVAVVYVGFLEQTADLRKKGPAPKRLFRIFFANIKMVFTAASPQWESLRIERPTQSEEVHENGIAREFLWAHLRRQGKLQNYQDFFSDSKRKDPKVEALVDQFVLFVIARGFEQQAVSLLMANEPRMQEARRIIQAINLGERKLSSI